MSYNIRLVALFLTAFLFLSSDADAQMVFLGRKALGKVRHVKGGVIGRQVAEERCDTWFIDM